MTTCPNKVNCVSVSTTIRPVTQVADVAVNRAVMGPQLTPDRDEMGSINNSAPIRMTPANDKAMTLVELTTRLRRPLPLIFHTSPFHRKVIPSEPSSGMTLRRSVQTRADEFTSLLHGSRPPRF